MNDPGLRRRRPNNIAERLANVEAEILTEVLTAFRRISLDVTIAKIADLTAGTVKIIGPEGSDFILIDATEIHAYIESSNFVDRESGFRISSTGDIEVNNAFVVGGTGSLPSQMILTGDTDGEYVVRTRWEADSNRYWDMYVRGDAAINRKKAFGIRYDPDNEEYLEFIPPQPITVSTLVVDVMITGAASGNFFGWRNNNYGTITPSFPLLTVNGNDYNMTVFDYNSNSELVRIVTNNTDVVKDLNNTYESWVLKIGDRTFEGADAMVVGTRTIDWNTNGEGNPFSTDGTADVVQVIGYATSGFTDEVARIPHLQTFGKMYYNNTARSDTARINVGSSTPTERNTGDLWIFV